MHRSRLFLRLVQISLPLIGLTAFGFGWPTRPPRLYDLKNVEWHVTIHPVSGTLEGDVINTIHLAKPVDAVTFDSGPLTIGSVTVNGEVTTGELKGETLTVPLPDKGAKLDYAVEIKYSGKPTAGIYFIQGETAYPAHTPVVYTQGAADDNRYWLPTYDAPDNKATSEGFITVPKGWKALSNGRLVEEKTDGDLTTIHWKMEQPHSTYLISFVAGPYDVGRESWGRMPVEYWVPEGLLDWGKATFGGTGKIIDFYSKQTGFRYPYAKFAQSAVPDFMFGGMENITCVTQSISALFPPTEKEDRDSTNLIAHELAHQWFGDTITCADWSHAWLNESFATFMPPFYTRKAKGDAEFDRERSQIYDGARRMAGAGPVSTKDFDYPSEIFRGQIYAGGAARLYMLMYKVGEKKFWNGVRDYLNTYKFQPATTEQFFAVMSKAAGEDLTPFMKEWILGEGIPSISVKSVGNSLVFTQSKPGFTLAPEAWIWAGDKWVKKALYFSPEVLENKIEVGPDLALAPVIVDPEGHFLLSQSSENKISPAQAVTIWPKLPEFSKQNFIRYFRTNQPSLLKLLADRNNGPWARALLGGLDATNHDVLLRFATSKEASLRAEAISRLRALFGKTAPAEVLDFFNRASTQESDPVLRASAFAGLMNLMNDPTMAETAWKMDVFGEGYRLEALRWWVANDPAKARLHALEALDTPLTEPVVLQSISILGRLGDAKGERVVYEHLLKILQGTAYRQRTSAMEALVQYGDKGALSAIEPITHESLFFTREAAQRAYESLKAQ